MLNGVCQPLQISFQDEVSSFLIPFILSQLFVDSVAVASLEMNSLKSDYFCSKAGYIEFGSSPSSRGFLTFDGKLTPE